LFELSHVIGWATAQTGIIAAAGVAIVSAALAKQAVGKVPGGAVGVTFVESVEIVAGVAAEAIGQIKTCSTSCRAVSTELSAIFEVSVNWNTPVALQLFKIKGGTAGETLRTIVTGMVR